jgi:hypothetical protein
VSRTQAPVKKTSRQHVVSTVVQYLLKEDRQMLAKSVSFAHLGHSKCSTLLPNTDNRAIPLGVVLLRACLFVSLSQGAHVSTLGGRNGSSVSIGGTRDRIYLGCLGGGNFVLPLIALIACKGGLMNQEMS